MWNKRILTLKTSLMNEIKLSWTFTCLTVHWSEIYSKNLEIKIILVFHINLHNLSKTCHYFLIFAILSKVITIIRRTTL